MFPPSRLFDPHEAERRRLFLINLLYAVTCAALLVLAAYGLWKWLLPFVLAFLLAAVLQRPLNWLARRTRLSRRVCAAVLVTAVLLLLVGLATLVCWRAGVWLVNYFSREENLLTIKDVILRLTDTVRAMLARLTDTLSLEALDTLTGALGRFSETSVALLTDWFGAAAGGLLSFVTGRLPRLLVGLIVGVVAAVFLTIEYERVYSGFLRLLPPPRAAMVRHMRQQCGTLVGKLARAYLLLMAVTFAELFLGLTVLRIHSAPILAAVIAVVDILPVLGTGTVLVPWALISLLLGSTQRGVGLLVVYLIITVVRNVLEPRVVSSRIGLHPMATLFFMYLGLRAAGLAGMLLFPLAAMLLTESARHGAEQA